MKIPSLVGATEIADMLGVTRQRVQQLAQSPEFPRPVAVLKMGQVWTLDAVKTWANATGREVHEERVTPQP